MLEEDRLVLDLDPSDTAVINMREIKYAVFELKVTKAQNKSVSKQTD
jgi:hypothetical protein